MTNRIKRGIQILSPAVILTLAPVAFSADEGITANEACAQAGTCCGESGSTCVIGTYIQASAYYKESGSCL